MTAALFFCAASVVSCQKEETAGAAPSCAAPSCAAIRLTAEPAEFVRTKSETDVAYASRFVEGDDPMVMHQKMAAALDRAVREIQRIQEYARSTGDVTRPRWPMIVLRSPKGWTGPKEVDGKPLEGCWRAHQVPIAVHDGAPGRVQELEQWLKSYRPEELFDENGTLIPELQALAPRT